jgi:hypothetical protein
MSRILFFDSEHIADETYGYQLRENGHEVVYAQTIEEFFQKLTDEFDEDNPPDLIILGIIVYSSDGGLNNGQCIVQKLTPKQLERMCILTSTMQSWVITAFQNILPRERIFSKLETSAKEFAVILETEFFNRIS